MSKKINIIITGKMTDGTIRAKLEPLSRIESIENIYFIRKTVGPQILKVKYLKLPSICELSFFNLLLTPLFLAYYTIKLKASYILSYHIIPYAFIAAIGSLLTGKPYFVCQTGLLIQKMSERKVFWFLLKRIILKANMLCVPGTASLEFWKSKGIEDSKIKILHSTIDTDIFYPAQFNERAYYFIYTGRIAGEKRIDFLLKAFASVCSQHREVKLLVVGDGPLLDKMKEQTDLLNISENVVFTGYQQNILTWLNKSKFIVLTSYSEGLPCSIMEGMSAGLIPITTAVGNLPDIVINGETGFCVEKDDIKSFVNYMNHLITANPDEIENIRQNARRIIVEQHSHYISIKKWKEILEVI